MNECMCDLENFFFHPRKLNIGLLIQMGKLRWILKLHTVNLISKKKLLNMTDVKRNKPGQLIIMLSRRNKMHIFYDNARF